MSDQAFNPAEVAARLAALEDRAVAAETALAASQAILDQEKADHQASIIEGKDKLDALQLRFDTLVEELNAEQIKNANTVRTLTTQRDKAINDYSILATKWDVLYGEVEPDSGITRCPGYRIRDHSHFDDLQQAKLYQIARDATELARTAVTGNTSPELVARLVSQLSRTLPPDTVDVASTVEVAPATVNIGIQPATIQEPPRGQRR